MELCLTPKNLLRKQTFTGLLYRVTRPFLRVLRASVRAFDRATVTTVWMGYFALEQRKTLSRDLDKWLRRRLRACYWKQWRKPIARVRKLRSFGIRAEESYSHGNSRKGPWRMSGTLAVQMALTTEWLTDHGLVSLEDLWNKFAPRRRIA